MPPIQRTNIPEPVIRHLLLRMREREISYFALQMLDDWLKTNPIVPDSRWFKRFPDFTVCGEGSLIKTMLAKNQTPVGDEMP